MSEGHSGAEIFVVDDDPSVSEVLAFELAPGGYRVTTFVEGTSLLSAARSRVPACIILDVNLPGKSGLDVLKDLDAWDYPAPIIVISGSCSIPMAVAAIKSGALDLIEKPFRPDTVLARVRVALEGWARDRRNGAASTDLPPHFRGRSLLTPRELDVLAQIAGGASNRDAGRNLGISMRTVEVHRAHIMDKLGARNAADLVRVVLRERHSRGHLSHPGMPRHAPAAVPRDAGAILR
jgi:two-component system, LuxR family, response regulator FixJ